MIIDNFLESYDLLKKHSLECEFRDIKNDKDGVVYPGICDDIPEEVKRELLGKLTSIHGEINNITLFMRMSLKGVKVSHIAHTDTLIGSRSLMLYLHTHPLSGTSFLRHEDTGITYHPKLKEYQEIIQKDANNLEKWLRLETVNAVENRCVLFDSSRIHCAEPVGGFGTTQKTARIVLTCFYD